MLCEPVLPNITTFASKVFIVSVFERRRKKKDIKRKRKEKRRKEI